MVKKNVECYLLQTFFLNGKVVLLSHSFSQFFLLFFFFTHLFCWSYKYKLFLVTQDLTIIVNVHRNFKCKMPKETQNFSKSLRTRSGCWCSIIFLLFRGRTPALALFTSLLVSSRSFLSSCSLLSFSFLISLSFCFLLCLSCSQLIL